MEYSIDQAKSIFTLLHEATWYAVPVIVALIFPLVWALFKKLLGIKTSGTEGAEAAPGDTLVFYGSVILLIIGVVMLKIGERREENLRQKAISLKQYFKIHSVISIPTNNLPDFYQTYINRILKTFPNDFLMGVNESGNVTIYCVDSTYIRNYSLKVNSLLTEYIDYRLAKENKVDVENIFNADNNLTNYFVRYFVYDFLSVPSNVTKYYLAADRNQVFLVSKYADSIQQKKMVQINTAIDEIIAELKTMPGNFEGFNVLRKKIGHPEYNNDFLMEVIRSSNNRLQTTKLVGEADPIGIKMG